MLEYTAKSLCVIFSSFFPIRITFCSWSVFILVHEKKEIRSKERGTKNLAGGKILLKKSRDNVVNFFFFASTPHVEEAMQAVRTLGGSLQLRGRKKSHFPSLCTLRALTCKALVYGTTGKPSDVVK